MISARCTRQLPLNGTRSGWESHQWVSAAVHCCARCRSKISGGSAEPAASGTAAASECRSPMKGGRPVPPRETLGMDEVRRPQARDRLPRRSCCGKGAARLSCFVPSRGARVGRAPAMAPIPSTSGSSCVTSLRFPPLSDTRGSEVVPGGSRAKTWTRTTTRSRSATSSSRRCSTSGTGGSSWRPTACPPGRSSGTGPGSPPCAWRSQRVRPSRARGGPGPAAPELPVGVASSVGFLPGDVGVSLCTTDLPLRFSEVLPVCALLLRSTPLATAHRNDDEQYHENHGDRDYGNDDAGAHPVSSLDRAECDDSETGARNAATGSERAARRGGGLPARLPPSVPQVGPQGRNKGVTRA